MRTQERICGGVVILDLHGALAAGAVDTALRERIRDLSRRGYHKVVLNLEAATGSSSSAVITLLGAMLTAHSEGCTLKLLHPQGIDNVQVLALCDYFEVFDREEDALASYVTATDAGPPPGSEAGRVAA
jgi:anti-anti-sigma regulatory factor